MTNGKRLISITVRMTETDARRFEAVAKKMWPGAVISRSAVILSLARIGAAAARPQGRKRT